MIFAVEDGKKEYDASSRTVECDGSSNASTDTCLISSQKPRRQRTHFTSHQVVNLWISKSLQLVCHFQYADCKKKKKHEIEDNYSLPQMYVVAVWNETVRIFDDITLWGTNILSHYFTVLTIVRASANRIGKLVFKESLPGYGYTRRNRTLDQFNRATSSCTFRI